MQITSGGEKSDERTSNAESRLEYYEVYCLDAHCILVSGDFYFRRRNKITKDEEWIQAEKISIGDWLITKNNMISIVGMVERKRRSFPEYRLEKELDGLYYANGFLTKSR